MKSSVVISCLVVLVAGVSGLVVATQLPNDSDSVRQGFTVDTEERLDCEYVNVTPYDEPTLSTAKPDARTPRAIADAWMENEGPAATNDRVRGRSPEVEIRQANATNSESQAKIVYRNAKSGPEIRVYLVQSPGTGWRLTRTEACAGEPVVNNIRVIPREPDEAKRDAIVEEAKRREDLRRTLPPDTGGPEQ
jgi:hypothetical protein